MRSNIRLLLLNKRPALGRLSLFAFCMLHSGPSAAGAQVASSPPALAQNTSANSELLLEGEPTVVTATKTPEHLSDSPSAVTIITAAQIRLSAAKTIPDLLRSVPGVDVFAPNGSQANVSIRGFNDQFSNTVLVLVDGRTINQDFYGSVFWNEEPILLSRIERIEIVRGPGSALYGADAFNGVINIITKSPKEMAADGGTHGNVILAQGGQDSSFDEANAAGPLGNGWTYALGGGYHASAGNGQTVNGHSIDSYQEPILTADLEKSLPDADLRFSVGTTNERADFNSIFLSQDADWRNTNAMMTYDQDHVSAPLLFRVYSNDLQLASTTPGTLDSRAAGVDLQQQRQLSSLNQLLYGLSYRLSSVRAFLTSNQEQSRQSWSAFAQDEAHIGSQTSLFTGIRIDNNNAYGTDISPRLSVVHHLPDAQTIRVSYATAFRAPTLLEEGFDDTNVLVPGVLSEQINGNPSLRPEELQSIEAGYRRDLPNGYLGITIYENQISGLIEPGAIDYAPSPPFPAGIPILTSFNNIGSGQASGIELEGGFRLPINLQGDIDYSYQNVTAGGQPASFSPHNKANLSVYSEDSARIAFSTQIHYVGNDVYRDQYQNNAIIPLSGYVRVDMKLGYRIGSLKHPATVSVAATNLFGDGHIEFPEVVSPLGGQVQSYPQSRVFWLEASTRW